MEQSNNLKQAKHLVVISLDAFSEDNWGEAKKLPNFSRLIENGAFSNQLKSVFPTHTYVAHTTIVTGVYPEKHGIHHNNQFQPFVPEKEQTWHWHQRDIKVPTIYDLARQKGLKTAALLWPVSGKSSIHYNLPEVAAIKNENQALKVIKNGSPLFVAGLELRLGKKRKGIKQPYLDDYITLCAMDTIRRKKPNLLLLHLLDLDSAKHNHGTSSEEVREALDRTDRRIGEIFQSVKEANIMDSTAFFVVGDHGQFDIHYAVHINNLLRDRGLICEEKGERKWRAYLQSAGGSAYLHLRDDDPEAEEIALSCLREAMKEEKYGIEHIYNRRELDNLQAVRHIKYAIEAKKGYIFKDTLTEFTVDNYLAKGIKNGNHGYSPNKSNYRCNFIASGCNIKGNLPLGSLEMVDIAPTMARVLGLDFYPRDGRVLEEMMK
ncbi:MAG: alkaline phosphatase family protein [Tindallia sp. MSAO_Bac2]|nr:MAG: alkaline phosphatase family protein [Tindallia sp. MSAO_Bac2]